MAELFKGSETLAADAHGYALYTKAYGAIQAQLEAVENVYVAARGTLRKDFPEIADELKPFFQTVELNLML